MKAEDINSFDVTPSWERPPPEHYADPLSVAVRGECACGMCKLAAGGHL